MLALSCRQHSRILSTFVVRRNWAAMSVTQHKCSFLQPRQQGSSDCIIAVLLNWTLPSQVPLLLQSGQLMSPAAPCTSLPCTIVSMGPAVAQAVICADGGANRLYDELPSMVPGEDAAELRKRYRPAAIKGDLDSLRPEIRHFYEGLGVHIIDNSADQDTTDLQKCLAWVREQQADKLSKCQVVVAGGAAALPMERCLLSLMLAGPC